MWDLRPRRTRHVLRTFSPLSTGPFSLLSCEMLLMTGPVFYWAMYYWDICMAIDY